MSRSLIPFTQIGSLPFNSIEKALSYSFEHSIPFVPDLPAVSPNEFMLNQASLSYNFVSAYEQVALEKFLSVSKKYDFQIWKNQLPGPFVMNEFLNFSSEDSLEDSFKVFFNLLDSRIKSFKEADDSKKIWIFIDEPNFFASSIDKRVEFFHKLKAYFSESLFIVIHYCGKDHISLNEWEQNLGLSFDHDLHPSFKSDFNIPLISGGIKKHKLNKNYIGVTPSCGLWGHKDPESILMALKKRAFGQNDP